MDQETITRGIISGIVDHYLREISQDPHRGIRKLIDMAERTSEGPTQKICYQMMQKMAANQSSPYYEMIHHLVTHLDPQTVKQFGMNLGHNAWAFGSGNIRRNILAGSDALSWSVLIDRNRQPDRIPFSEINEMIRKGREQDIYAWIIRASDTLDEWHDYVDLFLKQQDCVFGLMVRPGAVCSEILAEMSELHNVMLLLENDEPDWQLCAGILAEKNILFSVCRFISGGSDAEEILNGSWLEESVRFYPVMAFTIAADGISPELARTMKDFMWNTRLNQEYPILTSDLISDFVIINRLVAHRDAFYRVNADGSVSLAEELLFEKTGMRCSDLFNF